MVNKERIVEIADDDYHYTAGYYTANKWIDSETLVLARSANQTIGIRENPYADLTQLVAFSLRENRATVLCDDVLGFGYLVWEAFVYYTNGYAIRRIDTKTGQNECIYENAACRRWAESGGPFSGETNLLQNPHITADGRVITAYIPREKGPSSLVCVDTLRRSGETILEKEFAHPFFIANHWMPCPTNDHLFFFSHEGDTAYITNRLWLYDSETKKAWNIAPQRLDAEGNLIDCFGHEMWAPDGKGLYFVKYPVSPQPPRGICYVDVQTGRSALLYSAFPYWHVGVSPDGRYLTADTQEKDYSGVIVIDRQDHSEVRIDNAPTNWRHPCHPHPSMCLDNTKIAYTALNEQGRTCVRIAYLKKEA